MAVLLEPVTLVLVLPMAWLPKALLLMASGPPP